MKGKKQRSFSSEFKIKVPPPIAYASDATIGFRKTCVHFGRVELVCQKRACRCYFENCILYSKLLTSIQIGGKNEVF